MAEQIEEILKVGSPSSIFSFTKQTNPNLITGQVNMIDSHMICVGIQGNFSTQEINDFKNNEIILNFTEIDDILEIVYEMGNIEGDIAFNIHVRPPTISHEDILNSEQLIIPFSIIDLDGNCIALRVVEISEKITGMLRESFLRLDKKDYSQEDFVDRVDILYSKYSLDEIKKGSFACYVSQSNKKKTN